MPTRSPTSQPDPLRRLDLTELRARFADRPRGGRTAATGRRAADNDATDRDAVDEGVADHVDRDPGDDCFDAADAADAADDCDGFGADLDPDPPG